jgi:glutamine amidotransferase
MLETHRMSDVPLLIVDYGMGNLRSVANAFAAAGCEATISRDPADLRRARRIVLPGVGAFGDGMANLRTAGWIDALDAAVRGKGTPFIGLCLGMQLLAATGTEHGHHEGLGWIPGAVVRLPSGDPSIRIPHIGWNDVRLTKRDGLFAGLGDGATFYFVHSYAFDVRDGALVSGVCTHGVDFAASLEAGNVFATQFHPEKSQRAGLQVLRNFLRITAEY